MIDKALRHLYLAMHNDPENRQHQNLLIRGCPQLPLISGGLLITEYMTLRIKDIDYEMKGITVRAAKGNKNRATLFQACKRISLKCSITQKRSVERQWVRAMPKALYRKYPAASQSSGRQFVFPQRYYDHSMKLTSLPAGILHPLRFIKHFD